MELSVSMCGDGNENWRWVAVMLWHGGPVLAVGRIPGSSMLDSEVTLG